MNLCDPKQKAFAQRVYFDLKIHRKWPELHVYFDSVNKWIFFLGKPADGQPLTFVLPMSSDEQLTVDDLFNLRTKLSSALMVDIGKNIDSVLVAIIANDFTLGYFNFSFGLPASKPSDNLPSETTVTPTIATIDNEFVDKLKSDFSDDNQWTTTDKYTTWD